jgi:uncharacterized membrane protein YgcG
MRAMELGRLAWWRHLVVAATIAVCSGLAFTGLIGAGNGPSLISLSERFDAKQVWVRPDGVNGLRIREVVDQNFGVVQKHGYQRIIPNDFGVPTDVTASSDDAPDDLSVVAISPFETQIRIGDPNINVSGRHRYVLEYTLPDARLDGGELALDVIGSNEELETGRFEVIVTGLELDDPTCNVGAAGATGGCELAPDADAGPGTYRTVVEPLEPREGLTIGGTITGRVDDTPLPVPPPLDLRADERLRLALAMIPVGLASAGAVYLWTRRRGRNEVFAGGAAEAAYGELPDPSRHGGPAAPAPTVLVPDDRMDDLATIEFVPPKGLAPWQGRALLAERVDGSTVSAWFSGLAARDLITLEDDDGTLVLRPGPEIDHADAATAEHLEGLFRGRSSLRLGTYDKGVARVWNDVMRDQEQQIRSSGWWLRLTPGAGVGGIAWMVGMVAAFAVFGVGTVIAFAATGLRSVPAALVLGAALPAAAALLVYRTLLAVRSATGSALTLRTESFRRFLDHSEGQHVEWAWQQGMLREYSAWAVALDEADAWGRALARANVPDAVRSMDTTPLLVYAMASSFSASTTAPTSSSSGGGGGGFSGGSVGGGGGGGSSGSW